VSEVESLLNTTGYPSESNSTFGSGEKGILALEMSSRLDVIAGVEMVQTSTLDAGLTSGCVVSHRLFGNSPDLEYLP